MLLLPPLLLLLLQNSMHRVYHRMKNGTTTLDPTRRIQNYVSEAQPESEGNSASSLSDTQELQDEEEEKYADPPLSRSASLAKQIAVDTFITNLIREKGWSASTNWRNRELENVIQIAAIQQGIKITAMLLKKMIKARIMAAINFIA